MSSELSYPHRHQLLTDLLKECSVPALKGSFRVPLRAPQSFDIALLDEVRSVALDALLLRGWSRKGKQKEDDDIFHRLDDLRLQKSDFETIGRLGDGQYGVIDAVRCRLNGRVYAMKTMSKAAAIRAGPQLSLAIERHIHMLSHSSDEPSPIPKLVAAFQSEDTLSMVTTYAACGSLWDCMCSTTAVDNVPGIMTENELRWWASQMVTAIEWVHARGFVHRDIKPHNFLVDVNGRLLLTDFGSAAQLHVPLFSTDRSFVPKPLCAVPVGTPDYIAPEILLIAEELVVEAAQNRTDEHDTVHRLKEERGYDSTVDWWSLGATLYEMFTGRAPFWTESIERTYQLLIHYQGHLQLPDSTSPALHRLLQGYEDGEAKNLGCLRPEISTQPVSFPKAIDLHSLSFGEYGTSDVDEFTFNHFFDASRSTDITTPSNETATVGSDNAEVLTRWLGWSWDPDPDFFSFNQSSTQVTSNRLLPTQNEHFVTPARSCYSSSALEKGQRPSSKDEHALTRSHDRPRLLSERQAFEELIHCVQMSARKRISGGSQSSFDRSPWPRRLVDASPTPAPHTRDASRAIGFTSQEHLSSRYVAHTVAAMDASHIQARHISRIGVTPFSDLENRHASIQHNLDAVCTENPHGVFLT
ncbi:hypothetical protein IAR55_005005 [Kwoniella newhampshirensis]|uniref:cAMP-dependent protein kinase n=1 Tax=Kwoniella newhampshirensis TaxID=1651941 RepID=A0AAW0YIP6_9TREE